MCQCILKLAKYETRDTPDGHAVIYHDVCRGLILRIFFLQELVGQKADYLPSPAGFGEFAASHPPCQSRRSSRWATQREGEWKKQTHCT